MLIGIDQLYHLNVVLPSGHGSRTIKILVPRNDGPPANF